MGGGERILETSFGENRFSSLGLVGERIEVGKFDIEMAKPGVDCYCFFHKLDRFLRVGVVVINSGVVKHKADRGVKFLSWDLGGEAVEN